MTFIGLALIGFVLPLQQQSSPRGHQELVNDVVSGMESAVRSAKNGELTWEGAVLQSQDQFRRLLQPQGLRRRLVLLMQHFGETKDRDFGILIGMGRLGVPWGGGGFGYFPEYNNLTKEKAELDSQCNQLLLLIAEIQARFFLAHPEHLKRYSHFVAWTDLHSSRKLESVLAEIDGGLKSGGYWFHCRNFFCFSTSTDTTTVENLESAEFCYPNFEAWAKKMRLPILGVIPQDFPLRRVPKVPLPNWKGSFPKSSTFREFGDRSSEFWFRDNGRVRLREQ